MITDIIVIPIDSNELLQKVHEEAYNDKRHFAYNPTHVIMKNGEIIGAFSTWSPMCHSWLHTEKMDSKSFKMAYQSLDTLMRQQKTPNYLINLHKSSPLFPLLDKRMSRFENDSNEDWIIFINEDK